MSNILKPEEIQERISSHSSSSIKIKEFRKFVSGDIRLERPNKLGKKYSNQFINFGEITRDRKLGYMFGHPFGIKHKGNERVEALLSEIKAHNDFSHLTTATGREMMDVGKAYWLIYLDEKNRMKIKVRPMEEIILIRADNLTEETKVGIRYYMKYNSIAEKEALYVELYEKDFTFFYLEDKSGKLVEDPDRQPERNPFGYVPIVEFVNNNGDSDHKNIFDLTLLYNEIFNHGADEVLQIGNTYFKIINAGLSGDYEETKKLMESLINDRIFAFDEDTEGQRPDVELMNKNSDNSTFENFLESIRRRILEAAAVPDYEGITANNSDTSAKAMIQKLRPMEDYCKIKEDHIRTALRYFVRIFIQYSALVLGIETELKDYEITFKRNKSDSLVIENMNDFLLLKSTGLFSEEVLLSLLPFVDSPQNILEMRNREVAKANGVDYRNFEEM